MSSRIHEISSELFTLTLFESLHKISRLYFAHFLFPFQQLLSLWICEEKELVHEIAGLGELKSPWHKCQMAWLENHLNIINTYSQALETLDNYKGNIFTHRNILRLRTLKELVHTTRGTSVLGEVRHM